MRINKYISQRFGLSRRKSETLVNEGKVKINGEVLTSLSYDVSDTDVVEIEGEILSQEVDKEYYILNKPRGVVTTASEQFGRKCVTDFIQSKNRLFPVGRLDMYSEGLIILTNDGDFTNKIIHPTKHVGKTYELVITDPWSREAIERMKTGINIDGTLTKPAMIDKVINNSLIITIFEGRNRQLRKMCEILGYKVKKLKRIKVGGLELGTLKPGEYRKLSNEDIRKIFA